MSSCGNRTSLPDAMIGSLVRGCAGPLARMIQATIRTPARRVCISWLGHDGGVERRRRLRSGDRRENTAGSTRPAVCGFAVSHMVAGGLGDLPLGWCVAEPGGHRFWRPRSLQPGTEIGAIWTDLSGGWTQSAGIVGTLGGRGPGAGPGRGRGPEAPDHARSAGCAVVRAGDLTAIPHFSVCRERRVDSSGCESHPANWSLQLVALGAVQGGNELD